MSTLLKQVAQPQADSTKRPCELRPWQYNDCPFCGVKKWRYAKACSTCIIPLKKPQKLKAVKRKNVEQPSDISIKHLALNGDFVSVVDADEFERAMTRNWHVINRRSKRPYVCSGCWPSVIWLHHFILRSDGSTQIDHINGNTLDNRKCNLRLATASENCRNRVRMSTNKSGYMGVHFDKHARPSGKWRACIWVNGKNIHLGYFLVAEDAARCRDTAAVKYYGVFAKLNFPNEWRGGVHV